MEPLLMIRPPIGFCSFIMRNACWVHRNVPLTIEPTTPIHLSNGRSSRRPAAPNPALLNSTSSRPNLALAAAKRASTEAGSPTSVGTPKPFPCIPSISPTTALSGSGRRPATTTAKPSRASASADALPMPLPPPVTRATLPFDAMLFLLGSIHGRPQLSRNSLYSLGLRGPNYPRLSTLDRPNPCCHDGQSVG